MDYGHDLHFGVFLPPAAARPDLVVATAQEAEVLGLDSVSLQDHPYQPAHLDTWTLLTHLAAVTEQVTVFPNVVNLPLRPPAVLARSVATLDVLSGGRVELGLGAGAFWDAIEAVGGERRLPREAVDALEEAIAVVRAMWTPGRTPRLDGEHYRLRGAKPGPFPVHPVGIWLGAYGPRMLRLTGRLADGWLPSLGYVAVEQLGEMNATIDEAAAGVGRDPREIRRLLNVQAPDVATPSWVEQLAGLALDEGISGFVLPVDLDDDRLLRVFAEDVAPAVRELVEAERLGATEVATSVPAPPVRERVETTAVPGPMGDGDRLVAIHDHLRQELRQVQQLVEQVARGRLDAGAARSAINTMTMRQNDWTLGTYCESYCRLVTMHHTIEDTAMYPRLRAAEPGLGPALDRMLVEHHEIAGLLEDVDRALVDLVGAESGAHAARVEGVRTAMQRLSDVLLAHLGYEEDQLVDPLNRLAIGI